MALDFSNHAVWFVDKQKLTQIEALFFQHFRGCPDSTNLGIAHQRFQGCWTGNADVDWVIHTLIPQSANPFVNDLAIETPLGDNACGDSLFLSPFCFSK